MAFSLFVRYRKKKGKKKKGMKKTVGGYCV